MSFSVQVSKSPHYTEHHALLTWTDYAVLSPIDIRSWHEICIRIAKRGSFLELFGQEFYKIFRAEELVFDKSWKWKPKNQSVLKNQKKILAYNSKWEAFLPQKFNRGYDFILAPYGLQTGLLLQELKKKKKPFLYVNWDEFIQDGTIFYNSSENRYQLRVKKFVFDLKKIKNVFLDYNDLQEVFHYKRAKFNFKEQLFIGRWLETLKTLEFVLEKKAWWPAKPSQMKLESQNKFGELLKAHQVGFKIPQMIFTNDSREAQKFLFKYKSVLKESGVKNYYGNKKMLALETNKVDAFNKKLSRINLAPCMLQEFIEKKFDVRACVIGKKVLAVKIESKSKKSKTDWRRQEADTPIEKYNLPSKVQKKLVRFARDLGFQFASFDLVVDKKGDYYFLEMNRPGQWFFVEALSGIPIAKTLAQKF
jgi:glutathione synthase/RimK-type ligase-like ATP-grasp enzyme